MGFRSLLKERKEQRMAQKTVLNEVRIDTTLRAILGGTKVTVKNVLNIPAVSSSVGFITGTIASLPIRFYRMEGGNSVEVTDDYRLRLLDEKTDDLLDAFQRKCTLMQDYLLTGNGYTYVGWTGNRIDGLYYIGPMQVSAEIDTNPVCKTARFYIGGTRYSSWQVFRVLRNTKDGAVGYGVVEESPTRLETMLNALHCENHMVRMDGKKGFLRTKSRLATDVIQQLKNSWWNLYGNNSEESAVTLNGGIEFQSAGQTTVESQLDENRTTNDHETFKIFHIVPSVSEGGATAEDLRNTVRFATQPVVKVLQTVINRYCSLENEKGTFSFEIDLNVLGNTDMLSRYQAYEVAVRSGWMQLDEVRCEERRNLLGLKFIHLGLDTVICDPDTRMICTPNAKERAKVEEKRGRELDAGGDSN